MTFFMLLLAPILSPSLLLQIVVLHSILLGDDVLLNRTKFGTKVASGLYQAILSPVEKAYVTTNWHERIGHPDETAIKGCC